MRVLITGIAGFIGSSVAEELLQQGVGVYGIDDLSGGYESNVPAGATFFKRDCCQPLGDIFADVKPQVVMHLAAYAAEGLSHHIPNFNYHNNVVGTANVLSASHHAGVEHFVFTSSIAAYGHLATGEAITEDKPCQPCDPYGIAKSACEQHIAAFHEYYGGPSYTIFRPHNVFGPRQNISDPFRNVVGIFFRCAKQSVPMPVFGDGLQTRSFSYIDVVAKSIALSATTERARNEVFNVGGDQSLSVLKLAELISELTGCKSGIEFLPARKEVLHAHADHSKAKLVFPSVFDSAMSVSDGLELMHEFVRGIEVPAPTPCPTEIEIRGQLPPAWQRFL